jgi:hypothetical protein
MGHLYHCPDLPCESHHVLRRERSKKTATTSRLFGDPLLRA